MKEDKRKLNYSFKIFYKDGTQKICGGKAVYPEELYNNFDGLMPQDEFETLSKANLTTKQMLEMATRLYAKREKVFEKIEIINTETKEVVDFVKIKN